MFPIKTYKINLYNNMVLFSEQKKGEQKILQWHNVPKWSNIAALLVNAVLKSVFQFSGHFLPFFFLIPNLLEILFILRLFSLFYFCIVMEDS